MHFGTMGPVCNVGRKSSSVRARILVKVGAAPVRWELEGGGAGSSGARCEPGCSWRFDQITVR